MCSSVDEVMQACSCESMGYWVLGCVVPAGNCGLKSGCGRPTPVAAVVVDHAQFKGWSSGDHALQSQIKYIAHNSTQGWVRFHTQVHSSPHPHPVSSMLPEPLTIYHFHPQPAPHCAGGRFFDPFGLSRGDPALYKKYKEAEIKNGRLAMVAMLGFFSQYTATGKGPITNLTDHLADPYHTTFTSNGMSLPFLK